MKMNNKVLSLLGLARRAGKISWQEEANFHAIRNGSAKLLILAEDAGASVAKKYYNKSSYYGVPLIVTLQKGPLGHALGTSPRAAVVILDDGFAQQLIKLT